VDGGGGARDFHAVQQNALAIARDSGIQRALPATRRKFKRVPLNAHRAAPQGVAANDARTRQDVTPAGEPELVLEMIFLGRFRREQFRASGDFHQAFAALAIFVARGGNLDAQGIGAVKQGRASGGGELAVVYVEFYAHQGLAGVSQIAMQEWRLIRHFLRFYIMPDDRRAQVIPKPAGRVAGGT